MNGLKRILLLFVALALVLGTYASTGAWRSEAAAPAAHPDVDASIAFWQKRIAGNPQAYLDYTLLGQAMTRKARESGDVGYYQQAEEALQRATAINPAYLPALEQRAYVLFAMHDFAGALSIAGPLVENRRAVTALAIVGDAYLALGEYEQAEAAYQALAERGASPAVYSRQALIADLHGDPQGALALMEKAARLALESGEYGEALAWYEYQLGELHFKMGDLRRSGERYQAALDYFEGYYLALAGLGKIAAARGDYAAAIDYYQRATQIVPQPDLLAALGDVYQSAGDAEQARLQYDTVEFIGELAEINRQVYNRQLANFYSDHDLHLEKALQLASAELEVRRDVLGYDAAAWAYYKNGQIPQAEAAMAQALRLGTRDARLYYHAGMIALAVGEAQKAGEFLSEALSINPYFDLLQAPLARETLEGIGREL